LQKVRQGATYLVSLGQNPYSQGRVLVITGRHGKPEDIIKIMSHEEAYRLLGEHQGQLVMLPLTDFEETEKRPAVQVGAK